ncbi:putative sterol glucosyltransferase [Aspergillus ruber CBS 135680]|uniref:Sterol glucosyltransferase n=1 Tax=Aspergillus ruber (strain CBS 135680) TaxID=1388766 RepID=A0A017SPK3_ASPRC|nr:sterol glucosyltransferase [Aspergillus ruber CBS 135680]EYE98736.1 sterol glucosyltransferase [Aspergillus ruber CBS 135680]
MSSSKTQTVPDELFLDQPPPPYLEIAEDAAGVQDDGRIEVDLESSACKAAIKLIPWPSEDFDVPPPVYTEVVTSKAKLNIVIQVVGSRGDVQPFIALGNELQKHDHRVRIATHNVFDSFVRNAGLEFYPIGGDPADLMAYMVKNPGLIPKMKTLRGGEIQRKRNMVAEMLQGCWNSCIEDDPLTATPFVADAIIANPPSFAHVHCAQALGIPVHLMFTMPWSHTTAFPHPLANLKYSETSANFANFASYGIVEWMTWQGLGDVINDWRKTIDLEAVPITEGPNLAATLKIPFTYCWSPALIPKPADWASHIDVCGFFFCDPPNYQPPPDLDAFLRSGPPPVYIGFGSIVIEDPERLTAILLEAVRMTGVRAIISRGWSKLGGSSPSTRDIFYLGDCPHEWLFPRVAAVIHHGGAGTTACGLRYGRPTSIVPFFGDQPFWGNMVAAAGAGPKPIKHTLLNANNLADAIRLCMRPETSTAAGNIANMMQAECGVQTAVESFHRNLPWDMMQCQILPDEPATWIYEKSLSKPLFLSKTAAQVLADHLRLDSKDLQFHSPNPIVILNRRWDPITGTTSAAIGTGADLARATTDMFLKPYQEISRGRRNSSRPSTPRTTSSPSIQRADSDSQVPNADEVTRAIEQDPHSGWITTGRAVGAGAKGIGKFLGSYYKGVLVDIPLATTEGLRAVPRLYGEDVKDYNVKDWKSGALAGGRNFAHGMSRGLADIVRQPYKGGVEDGAVGVAKGFAKGTIGLTTKMSSAALGLVAYPGYGITKSIHAAVRTKTRKNIVKARKREGEHRAMIAVASGLDHSAMLRSFEAYKRENTESRPSSRWREPA